MQAALGAGRTCMPRLVQAAHAGRAWCRPRMQAALLLLLPYYYYYYYYYLRVWGAPQLVPAAHARRRPLRTTAGRLGHKVYWGILVGLKPP
jgi:hypothetical protein